jgi:tryptophan synthase alpha chain
MNRIDAKFADLRRVNKKAFIVYLTAGYPSLAVTEELVRALGTAGADIIELGVPFSDPMADGPTIQASSQQALAQGVTLTKILASVRKARQETDIPLVLMTYYNPVFHFGEERFVHEAGQAGVDGVIIPDLPPEEAAVLIRAARKEDMATIFFLAPTTTPRRMRKIMEASTGFIYYVSVTGVTGARQHLPAQMLAHIKKVKGLTSLPVCAGFGISTPEQVAHVARVADGVIVGSAVIKEIEKAQGQVNLVERVSCFVKELTADLEVNSYV